MTNLSKVSQDKVSKNQFIRSNVAKTQQPDAERLNKIQQLSSQFIFGPESFAWLSQHRCNV